MAINVQKYIKNMGKSVVYTASDVLSNKFDYVNEFKDTNKEVFKEAYSSIKDYRTPINRPISDRAKPHNQNTNTTFVSFHPLNSKW